MTFLHEFGHCLCTINNCECFGQDNKKLQEKHAYLFLLEKTEGDDKLRSIVVDTIMGYPFRNPNDDDYSNYLACREIMDNKDIRQKYNF